MSSSSKSTEAGRRAELRRVVISSLGGLAPHPSRSLGRALAYAAIGAMPAVALLVAFAVVVLWSFLEPAAGLRALLWIGDVLRGLSVLLAFMFGFGATGVLTLLASRGKLRFIDWNAESGLGGVVAGLTATVVFSVVGLGLILWSDDGRLEFVGHLLMVLPFLITLAVVILAAERAQGRRGLLTWGLIPLLGVGILYVSVIAGSGTRALASLIRRMFGQSLVDLQLTGVLQNLDDVVRAIVAIALVSAVMMWAVIGLREKSSPSEEDSEGPGDQAKPKSLLARVWGWIGSLFKADPSDPSPAPEGAGWMVEWFCGPSDSQDVPGRADSPDPRLFFAIRGIPAALVRETGFWSALFPSGNVTEDQVRTLATLLGTEEISESGGEFIGVLPDVMIEVEPGSGESEFVAAAAVSVVMLRGQSVLLLAADRNACRVLDRTMRLVIEHAFLDGLVSVEVLADRDDLLASHSSRDVPQIMVATVKDVQRIIFDPMGDRNNRKAVLAAMGLLLVHDLPRFDSEDRIQLPFVLHKIRLLQASYRSWVQLAVTTSSLEGLPRLRHDLRSRLFSPNNLGVNSLLRSWRPLPTSVIRVAGPGAEPLSAAIHAAQRLLPDWGTLIIVQPGIGELEAESIRTRIQAACESESTLRVEVFGSVDAMNDAVLAEPVPWVVLVEDGTRAGREIASQVDWQRWGDRCIWVGIEGHDGMGDSDASLLHVPVIGSSLAQGAWLPHAVEICRELLSDSPIKRNDWVQFGLPEVGAIPRLGTGAGDEVVVEAFRLECDPPDSAGALIDASHERGGGVFPWVSVRPGSCSSVADLDPGREYALRLIPPGDVVVVAGAPPAHGRLGYWMIDGQAMGASNMIDLAVASEFIFRRGSGAYVPESFALDPQGRVRIQARSVGHRIPPSAGRHPVWSLSVVMSPEELGGSRFKSVATHARGVDRCDLFRADNISRATVPITLGLRELLSDQGIADRPELVDFECRMGLTALTLGWSEASKLSSDSLGWMAGHWESGPGAPNRRLSPELTAALAFGLRRRAPGAERLGRLVAFDTDRGPMLLLLEPWSAIGSLSALVEVVLETEPIWEALLMDGLQLLEDHHDRPLRGLMACAGGGFMVDPDAIAKCDDAVDLLRSLHG